MKFSSLQKVVTYLLAGLGFVALSFGGEVPPLALLLLGVAFVASIFAEGPLLQSPWWSRAVTWGVTALLAVQIVRGFLTGGWLSLAMEFSGWLTISRLANRRNAADYQQVVLLAFMQLIASTVLTTDLGFGALFVAFVVVTPWALTLSHLRAEIERNYPEREVAVRGADVSRVLSSRRIVGPLFLAWTALLSVPTLFMTVSLFVMFPRIGLGFIGLGHGRSESVAGFGDSVELGGFGVIRDDPTVVLRVSAGHTLVGNDRLKALRLRGTAFDRYDGRTWSRSPSQPVRLNPVGDYYPVRRMADKNDLTLRIVLERIDEAVLFLPSGTAGFRIPSRGPLTPAADEPVVKRSHGLELRYEVRGDNSLVYEVSVGTTRSELDVPAAHDMDLPERYLGVPAGHERVRALAQQLRGDLRDPSAIAAKFEHYLREAGGYTYSLDQPDTHGRPPLEVFLFEAKRGHCEYFATALAIMLRAVDLPARNVTGFMGGEYNRFGNYYGIRQGDAHSWVEVLIPERGWVTFDPTPASAAYGLKSGLFSTFREAVDAMRTYWMLRVVGYNLRDQLRGARSVNAWWKSFGWSRSEGGRERGLADHARQLMRRLPMAGLTWLVAAIVIASLSWLGYRFRNSRARGVRAASRSSVRVTRLYRALEHELVRRGHVRAPHVTPGRFAEDVAARDAQAKPAVCAITAAFERVRYGDGALTAIELASLESALDVLRRAS